MRLVNVRLGDEDAAKVGDLMSLGVDLSDLESQTVRAKHAEILPMPMAEAVDSALKAIFARHPEPADEEACAVDPMDRHSVQALVRSKLGRR